MIVTRIYILMPKSAQEVHEPLEIKG